MMATTKRRKQATAGTPSQPNTPEQTTPAAEGTKLMPALVVPDPAGSVSEDTATQTTTQYQEPQPTPILGAEQPDPAPNAPAASASLSPANERAAFMRQRTIAIAGLVLLIFVVAFLAIRAFAPQSAITPATPAATTTPAATAQPVPTATAAPGIAANPTATAAPQAGVAAPGSGTPCSEIAGLPVFASATCTDQDSDNDDGVIKLKNTYTTLAAADDVRRFYEGAFAQNGWTLGKFKYDINVGQRRVQIQVETEQESSGTITTVQLTEHGAAAPAGTTCTPIAGLPALPNATCIKFDTDQDDGVFKIKNTYSTTASPENIWQFYQSALTQSGWAGQEFQYNLQQGPSRVEVNVEAQHEASGNFTEFKIAEK